MAVGLNVGEAVGIGVGLDVGLPVGIICVLEAREPRVSS
jgi:hypothetical protein